MKNNTQSIHGIGERLGELVPSGNIRSTAKSADIPESTLRRLLAGGDPKASTLLKLGAALKVCPGWLLVGGGCEIKH